jgi:signal transduction histidine kinase
MRGPPLQHRIVIPFVLVAVIATAAASAITLSVAAGALQSRLEAQLVSATGVVSRGEMALNRAILQNVHEVTGAHVLTFGPGGTLVTTTVDASRQELIEAARRVVSSRPPAEGSAPMAIWMDCGAPCLLVQSRVQARPDYVVALVAETADVAAATRTVARAILLAAVLSILVMVVVSQAVVRRVTAPLHRLVQFARDLSPGDSTRRAPVGDDEVGALAEAFNGMLDRLQQSQDALVSSEKLALAGVFAARVAHDIRNPLSSIKMQAQLLRGRLRDADEEATLLAVLRDVDQVESVIRDLLELARPGDLRLESASLNDVVHDALRQMAPQFAHRKIAVDVRLDERVPAVSLDRSRFKQALLNVLANASEAMPTGGAVSVASHLAGGSEVVLEICDNGVGVAADVVDRVFDPFFSTKPDGVGLGLVNVKTVIEGHGGRIRLARREPSGTCVSIALPAPVEAARGGSAAAPSRQHADG